MSRQIGGTQPEGELSWELADWKRRFWIQGWALLLLSCVALAESLTLSVPLFLYVSDEVLFSQIVVRTLGDSPWTVCCTKQGSASPEPCPVLSPASRPFPEEALRLLLARLSS